MAALASSAVSLYPTGSGAAEWFPCGKDNRSIVSRRLKLVLTGQGGNTNTIGATALGFVKLLSCSSLFDDTNDKAYIAAINPVANTIVLVDQASANDLADITTTAAYITVTGTV